MCLAAIYVIVIVQSAGLNSLSTLNFFKEGHVFEILDACIIDTQPLLINSLGQCASQCGMNSLCIAFDYCSLNGFHTCRFRFGQPTLSTTTTQCGFYKITANKDCPDGVFIRSQGICKNMTILPGLALLKPTQQSSTYRFYTAGYAVDGINGTDMAVDKCSSTDGGDTNPWWMVDLHTVYSITSVKIFNRGLEQGGIPVPDRLRNVTVTIGLTESTVNTLCGCFVGPGTLSQVVIIDCPTLPQGRFVKISKTTEYLTLCEVDVFGVAV